jgi:phosphoglycerate dehydrogenase-like enzyme
MRIVVCGSKFPDTQKYLRKALPEYARDEVIVWQGGQLKTLPSSIDVLIPMMNRIDENFMSVVPVRLIQQWGVGLDGVDIEAARRRNIAVANVAGNGGNADSVAEHAVLLTLALLRKLDAARNNVKLGILGAPLGHTLSGRTVCLYGLGAVALAVSKLMRAFGVRLIGLTRDPEAAKVNKYGLHQCFSTKDQGSCLRQTDVLILCVRHSDMTKDLIGEWQLAALPRGALLVNVARAGLIHYEALRASLESGHLGGAGLDVLWDEPASIDEPLLRIPNVMATPHVAGITAESLTEIASGVSENIERLRTGRRLLNQVA